MRLWVQGTFGTFSRLTSPFSSLFLSCSPVPCTHTGEQAHTHTCMYTRTCTHARTHRHHHHPQPLHIHYMYMYHHISPHVYTLPPLSLVLPAFGCCILLLLVPKTVLTLCNLRWWCFSCCQLAQRSQWHLQWALSATCASGIFLVPTSALSKVHTQLASILLLPTATCTGGIISSTNQAFTNVHTYK